MTMNLNNFSLLKEDDNSYEIAHPSGKKMSVSKSGMSDKAHKLVQALRGKAQHFDVGGGPAPTEEAPQPDLSNIQFKGAPAEIPANNLQIPSDQPIENTNPTPKEPASEAQPQMADVVPGNPPSMQQALQQKEAAAGELYQAQQGQGQSEVARQKEAQDKIDALPSAIDLVNANKAKDDMLAKAYQDKTIDPNRFWNNKSLPAKFSAGIGMILSGLGSGLTGGPNIAQQMIQKGIDNDIEAQKNDKGNALNAWKMNREALGNDLAANLATRNQAYTTLSHQLDQAASQFKGPVAKAQYDNAKALIGQEMATNNYKLSLMNGPTKENQDPAKAVSWLVPPEHQKAVFGEIQRAQDTHNMSASIMDSFDKAAHDNTILRTGGGLLRTPASVYGLHQSMQPTFQDLEGTVRQAAMDNTFKNITPAPGDAQSTIDEKRAALVDYLNSKKSAPVAKGFGIDLNKYQSTQSPQQGLKQSDIKIVNGQQMIKVPGGWRKVG